MKKRLFVCFVGALLMGSVMGIYVWGQTITSTIVGQVKDPSGSAARRSRNQNGWRSRAVSGMMFLAKRRAEGRPGAFFAAACEPCQGKPIRI